MPLAIPPELKPITPFVRRAEELDKDASRPESRLVAYYCRQYAVHQGIPLASASSAAKTCLGHLLGELEREKAAMDNFTRPEAEDLCRQFAYQVFDNADGEDRRGDATKTTAKTFYTSASFLQMLAQFYPAEGEETSEEAAEAAAEDKKRAFYAKWKATDILKAIKEGRTPTAGGYGEQQIPDMENDDGDVAEKKEDAPPAPTTTSMEEDAPHDEQPIVPPPVAPPPPPVETVFKDDDDEEEEEAGPPPPAYPGPPPAASAPSKPFDMPPPPAAAPPQPPQPAATSGWFGGSSSAGKKPTKAQFTDATELTKFALSALEDRDADLAAERLQQALQTLGRA